MEVNAIIRGDPSGKTAQIGRVDIRHANEGRFDAGEVLVLDKGVRARKVEMVRDQTKAHMGTTCNGTRRAGKDDVATTELIGVAHKRGHLGRIIALIKVDATRIHDDGHSIDSTDRRLKRMPGNRASRNRESVDISIRNSTDRLDRSSERTQTTSEDDGNGMLDARTATLDNLLINHDDSLLFESTGG